MNLVLASVVLGGLALLVLNGARHALASSELRLTLVAQGLWPSASVGLVVAALPILELVVGIVGLPAIVLAPSSAVASASLAAEAVLYFGFLTISARLVLSHSSAPCGCSDSLEPTSVWVPLRASIILLASLAYLADPGLRVGYAGFHVTGAAFSLLAGVAFALIAQSWPTAITTVASSPTWTDR
jgi:hypothetical protein